MTRRTIKSEPAVTPVAAAPSKPRRTPPRTLIRRLALLLAILLVLNELSVARAAGRVRMVVPTQELDQLEAMWSRFDQLSRRSYLRIGTFGLERSLTRRTMALADRVIADYRAPLPTVREAQWKQAQEALSRAHALAPDDRPLKAALRYCEGHLHRIDGEARKGRRQTTAAQHEFNEAVSAFREAAELRPKWADPFLGLARTFIYGLEDVDRAADALSQAERNGFTPGARETVQLGDGYRARGDTLARTARRLARMSQERDYLTRAAEAYQQALNLYAKAADYAGVPGSIVVAQRGLDKVQRRIVELSGVTSETGATPAAEERPWG
jgi:tetratricopeptide (TPR) repeat protein